MRLGNLSWEQRVDLPFVCLNALLLSHRTPLAKTAITFIIFTGWPCGGWRIQAALFRFLQKGKYFPSRGHGFALCPAGGSRPRCWSGRTRRSVTSAWVTAVRLFGARSRETPKWNSALCSLNYYVLSDKRWMTTQQLLVQVYSVVNQFWLYVPTFFNFKFTLLILWDGKHIFYVFSQTPTGIWTHRTHRLVVFLCVFRCDLVLEEASGWWNNIIWILCNKRKSYLCRK